MLNNCSCQRVSCWSKEMLALSLSNFLLYISIYILLPILPIWILRTYNCSIVESAAIVSSFVLATFISGPFNSYLIDTFKRRNVGVWGLIFLGLASLLYPIASITDYVLWIRIIQGLLFNIIIMSTGSTLLIDITPSKCRTDANIWFTRIGRLGMGVGLFLGALLSKDINIELVSYLSAVASILAAFLILFIKVPFRAPLKPALCSFDRFLLPRTFPVAINLILLASIFGILISCSVSQMFYIYLCIGFIMAFVFGKLFRRYLSDRLQIELGTLLILVSLLALSFNSNPQYFIVGSIIFGMGVALVSIRFYMMMINLPLHCERGSANNTYYLMWELGIFGGFMLGYSISDYDMNAIYMVALGILVICFLLYEIVIRKWYINKIENHNF